MTIRYFSVFFIVVSAFFLFPQITQAGVISQPVNSIGLLGYWSFEDNQDTTSVDDYSGNGNTGTMTNMDATPSNDYVAGYKSSSTAMDFDGINDYVEAANESNFDLERTDPFTLAAWVKTTNTSNNDFIINKQEDTGSVRGIWFTIDNQAGGGFPGGGVIELGLMNNGSTYSAWYGETSVTDGVWHHVVATSDGTGSDGIRLYVDGMQEATTTINDTLGANTILNNVPVTIGSRDSGGVPFQGQIDDARVYNRVLSATEVQRLYSQSVTVKTKDNTNLIGYWSFEDATSTTATDFSGRQHTGTLTNDPAWLSLNGNTVLDFDGSDDEFSVSDSDDWDFGTGDFSITMRINFDTIVPNTSHNIIPIINHGLGAAALEPLYTNWAIYYNTNNDTVNLYRFDPTETEFSVSWTPSTANWINLTMIRDGDNVSFYEGVTLIGTATGASGISFSTGTSLPLEMGVWRTGGNGEEYNRFNGKIDDVRIYDRAISIAEIDKFSSDTRSTKFNTSQNNKLTDGLVGHWSFNGPNIRGTLAEDTAGGNHGTLTNGPVPVQGKVGQGLLFDGSNDYITVADNAILNDNSNFSASLWVNMDDVTDSKQQVLVGKDGELWIQIGIPSGNGDQITVRYGSAQGAVGAGGDIKINTWHHIAMTFDGTNLRTYLDGNLLSGATTGSAPSGWDDVMIFAGYAEPGESTPNPAYYQDGKLDEVRLYNRDLTTAEVQRLYNLGR